MSYVPLRDGAPDNPDLANLPADAYDRLVPLGELIDFSHAEAYHQSECNCRETTCNTREQHWVNPSTEEILGWLVAKGLLTLDAIDEAAKTGRAAHVHSPGCLCVMVPMDVEGARECHYCGGHTGGPCGSRCDIARAEVIARD
jgi:hypothetical protein